MILGTVVFLFLSSVSNAGTESELGIRLGCVPEPSIPMPVMVVNQETPVPGQVDIAIPGADYAPALGSNWGGMNIGLSGYIPPDPIAAAGPNHVVSVVNCEIEWYTKAGTFQNRQGLETFFSALTPLTDTFDPKVIYDQYAYRFVVVTLERTASTSRILLAVSANADPNGTWYYQAINSRVNIGGNWYWADYPGFAVDNQAVYVCANMFPESSGSTDQRFWIIDKFNPGGGFYGGGTSTVNEEDPYGAVGVGPSTTQPTHLFGSAPGNVGTWLISAGWYGGSTDYLSVILVDTPLGTPAYTQSWVDCGDIHNSGSGLPDAPQLGSATDIETNDPRALHAVWRNNNLWTCNTSEPSSGPDAGQATAHWYRVTTNGSTGAPGATPADQGNVGGEDLADDTFTFFPSIAVDGADRMGIGFAASAATIYCGAYYTGRLTTDTPGTVQSTGTLYAGLNSYVATDGLGRNRWGDYSGISVDPVDDATFWVFNEYAGATANNWETRFGSWTFGPVPVELSSFLASATESGVRLEWRTMSESDNLGFNVYRATTPDDPRELLNDELLPGSGNSLEPHTYTFIDGSVEPGAQLVYWLEQIDFSGSTTLYGPVDIVVPASPLDLRLAVSPVPVSDEAQFKLLLPAEGDVSLRLYNLQGRQVDNLWAGFLPAGSHTWSWSKSDLPGGVYLVKATTGSGNLVKRIVVR